MTRCVSNWNFALRRVFSKKTGEKREQKTFNNLHGYFRGAPVAAGRTHHFSCTQRARRTNRRSIQRAYTRTYTWMGSTFRLTFVKQRCERIGVHDSNHFRADRFFDVIVTTFQIIPKLCNPSPSFPSPLSLPSQRGFSMSINLHRGPPQSPSPGIHLSSRRFTKDISFGKSEDSLSCKILVRTPHADRSAGIYSPFFLSTCR